MSSSEPAYELQIEGSHLGDDETDASLVKFPGSERILGFTYTEPKTLPGQLLFEANRESLRKIDYPVNDQAWPIMSQRMRDTLRAVGDFPHREIPVIMLDDTIDPNVDAAGNPLPGASLEGFAIVQLTEHIDAFDWERSEYRRSKISASEVSRAKKLVLKEVPLPPLFRLSALPGPLLVSAAARDALARAGIKGVHFLPLAQVL